MNRREEFNLLKDELTFVEPIRDDSISKAKKRYVRSRVIGISSSVIGFAVAILLSFVITVNTFPRIALACMEVPFLHELMAAFSYSESLTNMIENNHIQYLFQTEEEDGVTICWDYIIADQKQVNLVYRIVSEDEVEVDFEIVDEKNIEPDFISYNPKPMSGEYETICMDYEDRETPRSLNVVVKVKKYLEQGHRWVEFDEEFILNKDYMKEAKIVPIEQTLKMGLDTLIVKYLEIYPTHMRMYVEGDPKNTAWLTGMNYYFEMENGEKIETISNGITASKNAKNPEVSVFRTNSPYFYDVDQLRLVATNSRWYSKGYKGAFLTANAVINLPEEIELKDYRFMEDYIEIEYSYEPEEKDSINPAFRYVEVVNEKGEITYLNTGLSHHYDKEGRYIETFRIETKTFTNLHLPVVPDFTHRWSGEVSMEIDIP